MPRLDGGYTSAKNALLGRTEATRQLFSPEQLSTLYDKDGEIAWLSGDITQDRTPRIRTYLMNELEVDEVDPETIIRKLSRTFLQEQSDDWVLKIYEFLNAQPAIIRMLTGQVHQSYGVHVPLIRLKDGSHVLPELNGQPQAYLPSKAQTGFPTVRPAVCMSNEARQFLSALGLKEPDLVDDVIRNVLPKYQENGIAIEDGEYALDVARILRAFETDSNAQRQKLVQVLRTSKFVKAIDAGTAKKYWVTPNIPYMATGRMKELFSGVEGVYVVDDRVECLRGESIHELLEECGTTHYLRPVPAVTEFTYEERRNMRRRAGNEKSSGGDTLEDHSLEGLDELLDTLPQFDSELRTTKSKLLWDSLVELEDTRGSSVFFGTYRWRYYTRKHTLFDAAFVRKLNRIAWVADEGGKVDFAANVLFDELDWRENSFLQSRIEFKQPIVQELAREAGIEPESLDLIREHGVTAERLRDWLGLKEDPTASDPVSPPIELEAGRRGHDRGDGGGPTDEKASEGSTDRKPDSPPFEPTSTGENETREPFAKVFFGVQTRVPSDAPDRPVILPEGGPQTDKAVRQHTEQSGQFGRAGDRVRRAVMRWEPTDAANELAEKFRSMVSADYDGRCQICGAMVVMSNGDPQVFVVHLVRPSVDERTNHPGNLLGLCGWHYALMLYGQKALLDPETGEPCEDGDWERMRDFVLSSSKKYADDNTFIRLPIRFWNVYQDWNPDPVTINAEIRYSVPHWKYLCKLLKA